MNYNHIIIKHEWLNLCVGILLVENDIKKYGILRANTREDYNQTKRDVFKVDFLNYINFCHSNKCFSKLSVYMKESLKKENIDFADLFTNVEYKLNLELDENIEDIIIGHDNTKSITLSI